MLRMVSIGDKLDSCLISKRATSGDNKDKIKEELLVGECTWIHA